MEQNSVGKMKVNTIANKKKCIAAVAFSSLNTRLRVAGRPAIRQTGEPGSQFGERFTLENLATKKEIISLLHSSGQPAVRLTGKPVQPPLTGGINAISSASLSKASSSAYAPLTATNNDFSPANSGYSAKRVCLRAATVCPSQEINFSRPPKISRVIPKAFTLHFKIIFSMNGVVS
jgi:hypothetical protein